MGISARWLLTGQGPMFERSTPENADPMPDVMLLHDIIEQLELQLRATARTLSPKRKALLISEVYAMVTESSAATGVDKVLLHAIVKGMVTVSA